MFRLGFGLLTASNKSSDTSKNENAGRKTRLQVLDLEARVTPNASLIATSFYDGAIYRFDADSGAVIQTLAAPTK